MSDFILSEIQQVGNDGLMAKLSIASFDFRSLYFPSGREVSFARDQIKADGWKHLPSRPDSGTDVPISR